MLKNLTSLTHKIGERFYTLYCDMDSPIQEVKEALFKFVGHVDKIEEGTKAQVVEMGPPAPESKPVETPKQE